MTARIVMIADAIDSMMRARPYRDAIAMKKVLSELKDYTGIQFDSLIVDLILKGKISLE